MKSKKIIRINSSLIKLLSAIGLSMYIFRVVSTGNINYWFLVWNLFLAAIPLVVALKLHDVKKRGNFHFTVLFFMWLIFYPNSPYIFTDLKHLYTFQAEFNILYDSLMVLTFSVAGLFLGFESLILISDKILKHRPQDRPYFTGLVHFLAATGIYIGRFLRFSSWDLIFGFKPLLSSFLQTFYRVETLLIFIGFSVLCTFILSLTFASYVKLRENNGWDW